MNQKFYQAFLLFAIPLLLCSCAGTIKTIKQADYKETSTLKRAYIISVESSNYIKFKFGLITPYGYITMPDDPPQRHAVIGNTDKVIKAELEKNGVQAEIGKKGDSPEGYDFVVLYRDIWRWDLKKILQKLEIVFISAADNKEIARSVYDMPGNMEIHNFPTPEKEVPKMIKQLLAK